MAVLGEREVWLSEADPKPLCFELSVSPRWFSRESRQPEACSFGILLTLDSWRVRGFWDANANLDGEWDGLR